MTLAIVSDLTTEGLPPGKTVEEALALAIGRREFLWRQDMDEDERIDRLTQYCTKIYCGDELKGKLLASLAIWS